MSFNKDNWFKYLSICWLLAGCQADPFGAPELGQLNGDKLSGDVSINFWLNKSDSADISIYYPNWSDNTEIQLRSAQDSINLFLPTSPLSNGFMDIPKLQLNGIYTPLDKDQTGILYTTKTFSIGIRDASQSSQTWQSNSWNADNSVSVSIADLIVHSNAGKEEMWGLDIDGNISKSVDGLNWTTTICDGDFLSESPPLYSNIFSYPRWEFASAVFNDPDTGKETIWVIGGNIASASLGPLYALNDVQKLVGDTWVEVVASTDPFQPISFTPRYGHTLTVFPDVNNANKPTLWIIGGHADDFFTANNYYNDIWKSVDGKTWNKVTTSGTIFSPRKDHQVLVMTDPANNLKTLWLIGGYDGTSHLNDIWKSTNGVNWTKVTTSGALFYGRGNFGNTVVNDPATNIPTMLLFGGETDIGAYTDVWKSTDGVHWVRVINTGLLATSGPVATIHDVSNANQFSLFVVGYGVYRSTDGWSNFKRGGGIKFNF